MNKSFFSLFFLALFLYACGRDKSSDYVPLPKNLIINQKVEKKLKCYLDRDYFLTQRIMWVKFFISDTTLLALKNFKYEIYQKNAPVPPICLVDLELVATKMGETDVIITTQSKLDDYRREKISDTIHVSVVSETTN